MFPRASHGFTLVELVMVIVILGVMTAVVAPKLMDSSDIQARGFADQVKASLRYAQKTAIAQRGDVFVNVNGATNTLCLTYAADNTCTNAIPLPIVTKPPDQLKAPTGITIASSESPFSFSALGKPLPDTTITLSVTDKEATRTIIVERETGYVH